MPSILNEAQKKSVKNAKKLVKKAVNKQTIFNKTQKRGFEKAKKIRKGLY